MNNFQSQQQNQQLLQQYFHRFRQCQTSQNQNNGQLVASNGSGVPNNVNGDYWSWWNNMWLQSMTANKAYYYYYTSKAALMNQSSVGLIRSARSAKMPQTTNSSSSSKPLHQNLYPNPNHHDHNHDRHHQPGTSSSSIVGNQDVLMNNNNFEGRLLGGGNGGWSHYNDLEMVGEQNEIKMGKNQERQIQQSATRVNNNHHHVEDVNNHHDDNDVYPFGHIPLDMPLMEGDLPNDSNSTLPQSPLTSGANMSSYTAEYDSKIYMLECFECKVTYNTTNCRPVEEACGHMKCRICFISNEDGCPQCRMDKNRLNENLNSSATLPKKKIIATYGRSRPFKKKSPTINSVSKGPITNDIVSSSAAGGMTYSSVANSLVNNRRGSGLSDTGSNDNNKRRSKRIQDSPSNSLEIDSNSLLGNKDDFPPPPKLLKDNFNSGSRMQAKSTDGINARITNDIGSLATPGSSKTIHENSSNNAIEKIRTKSKKKRSPVLIHAHITILSSGKEGQPAMYQCNVCTKKFKTKAHIKYHEFCQNGEKPFKCESCGQGFIAKSHYEYHLRTHTGERPYVCPKCGKGFNQRGKVTRHLRSHTGEKPFVCQSCGRGFANAQALRSHNLIHTGERPYPCQYCNKRFTGMTNLKKHVITHTGERPFMCVHCGKSFGLKWTLDLHLRTHSSERPHACDQCARAFSNSKDLRRHLVIHSGERPFKCWICGTTFRRKDNLDRHIKNTHNQPRDVARQLANEAAAEYLASQKEKAPTPTTNHTKQNLNNNKKGASLKTNSPHLPKGASMSNDKSKKIQESIDKFSRSVKKKKECFQNKSSSLSSIEEEAMRLLNDITPPDITTSIENGQVAIYVKSEPPDIENYGEPESAVNRDGEMTENRKPESVLNKDEEITESRNPEESNPASEGQETSTLEEISTIKGQETSTFEEISTEGQETSTLEEISTTKGQETSTLEEISAAEEEISVKGQETSTLEEISTIKGQETSTLEEMSTTDGQETSTFEEMSTTDGQETSTFKEISTKGQETSTIEEIFTAKGQETSTFEEISTDGQENSTLEEISTTKCQETSTFEDISTEGIKTSTFKEISTIEDQETSTLEEISTTNGQETPIFEEISTEGHETSTLEEISATEEEISIKCQETSTLEEISTEGQETPTLEEIFTTKGQETSTFEEISTDDEENSPLEEISTTKGQETSTLDEISTTDEQNSPIGELEIHDQMNEMFQVEETKVDDEVRENSRPAAEGNSQEEGVNFDLEDRMRNSLKIESNEYVENNSVLVPTPSHVVQVEEESMRILYAKATARAEPSSCGDGTKKVTLLYAEALGVKGNGSVSDPYQYVYTSTKPNQEFYQSSESHAVQISSPEFYPVGENICLDQVERWFKGERNSSSSSDICCASSSSSSSISISSNHSNSVVNASTDPIDIRVKTDGTGYADASLIVHHHEYLDPPQEHPEDYSLGPVNRRSRNPNLVDDYSKYLRYSNLRSSIEVDEGVEMVVKTENEK